MCVTNCFLSIRVKRLLSGDGAEGVLVFWRCWFKPFFLSNIFLQQKEKSHVHFLATRWDFGLGVRGWGMGLSLEFQTKFTKFGHFIVPDFFS